MSTFKTLENFAFQLKKRNNGDLTKYIKFDEFQRSMYLQVRHRRESDWITFTAEQARREMDKENNQKTQRSRILTGTNYTDGMRKALTEIANSQEKGAAGSSTASPLKFKESRLMIAKRSGNGTTWKPPARGSTPTGTSSFILPDKPTAKRIRDDGTEDMSDEQA